jgi:hypothetical protein
MESFLAWLQDLPLSVWVAESDSIWGYAFMLFVHAVGMGLTAGLAFVICLRLLGVGTSIPVSSLRVLFRVVWLGVIRKQISGVILFMSNASGDARVPVLYVKFVFLGIGVFTLSRLRAFIDSERSDAEVPSRVRTTAVACIVVWLGVITAGRLIAYAVESSGASLSPSAPAQIASSR